MDKKAIAISGLSALLLASASGGNAEAEQKLITPSATTKTMIVPPAGSVRALDTQRSKTINQASPAAITKLNRIGAEIVPWLERWAQANTSATNPVGNVQKTLKQQ
jgi:hypothetical protein